MHYVVQVWYLDGTTETFKGTDVNVHKDVLNINNRVGGIGYSHFENVASFPLTSIRRYSINEEY